MVTCSLDPDDVFPDPGDVFPDPGDVFSDPSGTSISLVQ